MPTPETQTQILAILPKVAGGLSMLGSGAIVHDILSNRQRRQQVYHRLVCGLSISDFWSSFCLFCSTWPIPRELDGYYGNIGSPKTCEVFGFFSQTFAIGTPFYNLSLCFYYLLVIKWGLVEQQVKGRYEIWLHLLPISVALGTGIAGIPLTLYNPAGFLCWIASDPPNCDSGSGETCRRGSLFWLFRWVFFYAWIWFIFVFLTICMYVIYRKVRQQELVMEKYRFKGGGFVAGVRPPDNSNSGNNGSSSLQSRKGSRLEPSSSSSNIKKHHPSYSRRRSRKVAHQAMQYVCSYYLTFLFGTITRLLQLIQDGKSYFPILVLFATFYPLQGTFNAIIYFRARISREAPLGNAVAAASALGSGRRLLLSQLPEYFRKFRGSFRREFVVASEGPASQVGVEMILEEGQNNSSGHERKSSSSAKGRSNTDNISHCEVHHQEEEKESEKGPSFSDDEYYHEDGGDHEHCNDEWDNTEHLHATQFESVVEELASIVES